MKRRRAPFHPFGLVLLDAHRGVVEFVLNNDMIRARLVEDDAGVRTVELRSISGLLTIRPRAANSAIVAAEEP